MSKEQTTTTREAAVVLASPGEDIFHSDVLTADVLPAYLKKCRWFGGKARNIEKVSITEKVQIPLPGDEQAWIIVLHVRYEDNHEELYLLPLSYTLAPAPYLDESYAKAVIGQLTVDNRQGVIYDAIYSPVFRSALFRLIYENKSLAAKSGQLYFEPGKVLDNYSPAPGADSRVLNVEQSNSSIIYHERFFLKLYRKLDRAINPDLEINRFFSEKTSFTNVPSFAGGIELREDNSSEPIVIGMMQELITSQGDAWAAMLPVVKQYFGMVRRSHLHEAPPALQPGYARTFASVPASLQELIGAEVSSRIELLARRTAEMHLALASDDQHPDFVPEAFTVDYQKSMFEVLEELTGNKFRLLTSAASSLPAQVQPAVKEVLALQPQIVEQFKKIYQAPIQAFRTRIHGDYHLGQVLFTGSDYIIIDFEGEPASSFEERRRKYSPLKDVAGMMRSFHYATYAALLQDEALTPQEVEALGGWAEAWYQSVSGVYLHTYLQTVNSSKPGLLPKEKEELETLLQTFLLEKAVYEFYYEANNRPDWMVIPFRGILQLIGN